MKQVIRIEHECGLGMFTFCATKGICNEDKPRADRLHNLDVDIHDKHKGMPEPHEEGLDTSKDGNIWLCAYKSLDQMRELISNKDIITLLNHNYKVYLYHVSEYQEGEFQIIFNKSSIIERADISSIFTKK